MLKMNLAKMLGKFLYEVDTVDSPELTRWQAYEELVGFAPNDTWKQCARLAWMQHTGKLKECDFDPYHIPEPHQQTGREQLQLFLAAFPNTQIKSRDVTDT